jgi:hypothetical protein
MIGACWRLGFFRLGGRRALSGIGRVSPTSRVRGLAGRDRITPFPKALKAPAGDTRYIARARTGYSPSSLSTFTLTPRGGLPVLFTIRRERILQLGFHQARERQHSSHS